MHPIRTENRARAVKVNPGVATGMAVVVLAAVCGYMRFNVGISGPPGRMLDVGLVIGTIAGIAIIIAALWPRPQFVPRP